MIGDLRLFNMGSFLKLLESGMPSLCVYEKHSMEAMQYGLSWDTDFLLVTLSYQWTCIKLNASLKD